MERNVSSRAQAAAKQMRKDWEGRLNMMGAKVAHASRKDAKRKIQLGKRSLLIMHHWAVCVTLLRTLHEPHTSAKHFYRHPVDNLHDSAPGTLPLAANSGGPLDHDARLQVHDARLQVPHCEAALCCAESVQAALAQKAAAEARQAGKARDFETALREASSLFKAEMAVKAAELQALHAELRYAWTFEFL